MPARRHERWPTARIDTARPRRLSGGAIDGFGRLDAIEKFISGQSNPTYLLTRGERPLRAARQAARHAAEVGAPGRPRIPRHEGARPTPPCRCRACCICRPRTRRSAACSIVMDFVEGRIFWDPALPEIIGNCRAGRDLRRDERARSAACTTSTSQPSALPISAGPAAISSGSWRAGAASTAPRETGTDRRHGPADRPGWQRKCRPTTAWSSLVHGDYRLDNMIFRRTEPRVVARARLGTVDARPPLADLAYQCMQWRLPHSSGFAGWAASTARRSACPPKRPMSPPIAGGAASPASPLELLSRLLLLPAGGDLPGRLPARAGRQRLQPEKGDRYGAAVPVLAGLAVRLIDEGE